MCEKNWIDVGCDDFKKAAANRKRVAEDYCGDYYRWLENSLAGTPIGALLPKGTPIGELAEVGKTRERRNEYD